MPGRDSFPDRAYSHPQRRNRKKIRKIWRERKVGVGETPFPLGLDRKGALRSAPLHSPEPFRSPPESLMNEGQVGIKIEPALHGPCGRPGLRSQRMSGCLPRAAGYRGCHDGVFQRIAQRLLRQYGAVAVRCGLWVCAFGYSVIRGNIWAGLKSRNHI